MRAQSFRELLALGARCIPTVRVHWGFPLWEDCRTGHFHTQSSFPSALKGIFYGRRFWRKGEREKIMAQRFGGGTPSQHFTSPVPSQYHHPFIPVGRKLLKGWVQHKQI